MTQMQWLIFFSVIFGLISGILGTVYILFRNVDALLGVDTSDPEKDKYNFVILCPLDYLQKKKYLIVEVKKVQYERTGRSN